MATLQSISSSGMRAQGCVWRNLKNSDGLTPQGVGDLINLTVEVSGDFGSATVEIVGAIVGRPSELTDWQGLPVVFTQPGIKTIAAVLLDVLPVIHTPDSKTNVTIAIFGRK